MWEAALPRDVTARKRLSLSLPLSRFRIQRYTSFPTLPFMYKDNMSAMASVGVWKGFFFFYVNSSFEIRCLILRKGPNAHIIFFLPALCSILQTRFRMFSLSGLVKGNFANWRSTIIGPMCYILKWSTGIKWTNKIYMHVFFQRDEVGKIK